MNVEEKAKELLSHIIPVLHNRQDAPYLTAYDKKCAETMVADALRAAMRPPKGHIIDETGAVRRVLGTLPVTADGCVVGDAATIWHYMPTAATAFWNECTGESSRYYANTYSSEAAARAAAEAERGAEG